MDDGTAALRVSRLVVGSVLHVRQIVARVIEEKNKRRAILLDGRLHSCGVFVRAEPADGGVDEADAILFAEALKICGEVMFNGPIVQEGIAENEDSAFAAGRLREARFRQNAVRPSESNASRSY
jgi:hypothetical protein